MDMDIEAESRHPCYDAERWASDPKPAQRCPKKERSREGGSNERSWDVMMY